MNIIVWINLFWISSIIFLNSQVFWLNITKNWLSGALNHRLFKTAHFIFHSLLLKLYEINYHYFEIRYLILSLLTILAIYNFIARNMTVQRPFFKWQLKLWSEFLELSWYSWDKISKYCKIIMIQCNDINSNTITTLKKTDVSKSSLQQRWASRNTSQLLCEYIMYYKEGHIFILH